ncbi:ABC transporter permease subunit [Streptomyces chartreusis]|uniref:ABC transporter permease subunit n=1 Tax=Streptomyces chartreusis TaxID=1969 RepID=UPI003637E387
MLPFIIAGLAAGSVYGLAAFGLVLTYKTSGVFNFGQGALASASAFLYYFLAVQHGVPWPVAVLACVFVFGPLLGLALEFVARRLAGAAPTIVVLGTVGVLLAIQGSLDLIYPPGPIREVHQFLPTSTITMAGTKVAWSQIITFLFGIVVVCALTLYLRRARLGLAMRGVVDAPGLLGLTGQSPARVRRAAWVIGTTLASASGVLIAPLVPLDSTSMTLLVVTAFGAAAIGAFSNLPLAYLGGLVIGVGQALLQKEFVQSTGVSSGFAPALPFLVLFVLLVAAPRLRPPSRTVTRREVGNRAKPWRVHLGAAALLLVALALAPQFDAVHLLNWTRTLAYAVVFLSLGLLVRVSGQVSLAQVTFMAIGVAAFSQTAVERHWPWALGLLAAAIVAAPIGAVLAIPAIRFPGVYLALATLGFGILVQQMFYFQPFMFGSLGAGLSIAPPDLSWLSSDPGHAYYYLCLAVLVIVTGLVIAIERSLLGRLLAAMKDSPTGLASTGASINVSRVLVFSLASAVAAVGGVLDAGALGVVGGDSYPPILSIQLFAVILLVVGPSPWYAVLAAAGQVLLPAYISLGVTVGYVFTVIFGLSAIFIAIGPANPAALPAPLARLVDPVRSRLRPARKVVPHSAAPAPALVSAVASPAAVPVSAASVPVAEGSASVAASSVSDSGVAGADPGRGGPSVVSVSAASVPVSPSAVERSGSVPASSVSDSGVGSPVPAPAGPPPVPDSAAPAPVPARAAGSRALEIDALTVRFGGLVAVKEVGLVAEPGKIVGLIGPNGAGKSTIFNASTGLVKPASGTVAFGGRALGRLGPPARARLGLGRTFQQMELFDSLTVLENLRLGAGAARAGLNPLHHVFVGPRKSAEVRRRAQEALELCGLTELAEATVGSLSTGHRRLVELARCAAGRYDVLLLDEPSSGLDRTETAQLGDVLLHLVRQRGMGLLLVEHDMALVNTVCDYVHVIDFGQKIFQGTVAEVAESPEVRRAYLGEETAPSGAPSAELNGSR